jgi:hypothetical protein
VKDRRGDGLARGRGGDGERVRDEGWEEAQAHRVATGEELSVGLQ